MFKVINTFIHSIFSIIIFIFQIVLACVFMTVCHSQKPYVEEGIPKPYTYQYAVADDYSKANFQKSESQDANVRPPSSSTMPSISLPLIFSGKCQGTVCDCPPWWSYPDNLLHCWPCPRVCCWCFLPRRTCLPQGAIKTIQASKINMWINI